MKRNNYIPPSIVKEHIGISGAPDMTVSPSQAFETEIMGQLLETINLVTSRNQSSADYQSTFQLSKKRLEQMLRSGNLSPSKRRLRQ